MNTMIFSNKNFLFFELLKKIREDSYQNPKFVKMYSTAMGDHPLEAAVLVTVSSKEDLYKKIKKYYHKRCDSMISNRKLDMEFWNA